MSYNYRLKVRIKITKENPLIACLTYLQANYAEIVRGKVYGSWENGEWEMVIPVESTNDSNAKEISISAQFFGLVTMVDHQKQKIIQPQEVIE